MTWHTVQTLNPSSGRPMVRHNGELAGWIVQYGLYIQISVAGERDYTVVFTVVEL